MNNVTASFSTSVRQMTEMSWWPKCLGKNYQNVSQRKGFDWHYDSFI